MKDQIEYKRNYDVNVNLNMQTHDFMQIQMEGIREMKCYQTQRKKNQHQNESHEFFNLCTQILMIAFWLFSLNSDFYGKKSTLDFWIHQMHFQS